jgi:hypothetical protein
MTSINDYDHMLQEPDDQETTALPIPDRRRMEDERKVRESALTAALWARRLSVLFLVIGAVGTVLVMYQGMVSVETASTYDDSGWLYGNALELGGTCTFWSSVLYMGSVAMHSIAVRSR